ncbi:50S ribosomal protein L3 [Longimicrobium sp.]|uniref:50S ribosomal protein L3 n=1 Tax=Longimicrobium sp. TaxID=2029185 RepID=UPI002B5D829D|nr:50S ribosomal protein L3 [Longimicrobium sp.]HSU13092.1 50S ribosomal protein L3 [Longimicrobium sp.]
MNAIIGRKLGMTQIFDEAGAVVPVTVIEAGPCPVVQVRSQEKEGYTAVQLGFGQQKDTRASKAEKGHALKAGLQAAPAVLKEFRFDETPEVGSTVTVGGFERGGRVKVTGVTKGRGFQGVMKRHGFGGGRASHGATRIHRAPGSIGAGTNPSRVIKGKRMPGHMGAEQQTVRNLLVAKVDAEKNLLYVRGAVPGPVNGVVFVQKQ